MDSMRREVETDEIQRDKIRVKKLWISRARGPCISVAMAAKTFQMPGVSRLLLGVAASSSGSSTPSIWANSYKPTNLCFVKSVRTTAGVMITT